MKYVHVIAIACCLAFGSNVQGQVAPNSADLNQVVEYNLGIQADEETVPATPEGKASKIVVVSATWCVPCQTMKAALYQLKVKGYKVEIYNLDWDAHAELLAERYSNIKKEEGDEVNQWTKYPTIFYIEDGTIIKKEVGRKTKKEILKTLWKPDEETTRLDTLFQNIKGRLPWKN